MEDAGLRRRQNEPPAHPATSNQRYTQQPIQDAAQQRRYAASTPTDRYRSTPLNSSTTGTARGIGGSAGYSGYYQDSTTGAFQTATAMPQSSISSYHQSTTDYSQDGRQTQSFTGYNPASMMYNVQSGAQNSAVYDTSQQSFQRQPAAALQMMAADVTSANPYFSGETGSSTTASLQTQAAPSNTSSSVYQNATDRSALLGYSNNMAGMGGIASQTAAAPAAATATTGDVGIEEQEYPATSGLDEAYASYQSALKEIFQNVKSGILQAASESLLNVSDWLLSHVTELGLTSDDQDLYNDRIKLWNDFNHAWLSLLQMQKELMESGQQLQRSQTLISREGLEKMAKELLRLCDQVERHGLVDYQYGVWEEQIIAVLEECSDLYGSAGESSGAAAASSSRRQ
ncbi:hypothetical protein GGTG_06161 [Gaeumannomyces tritici R3-111a-1]|uniref:Uncharacterized protein n=1 Tax=Gaeumannomyces tritici (strain R3-111a-1) TaxID=644352 RepID=J3NY06_GAET3|nr:hypothetical protein GGTG_06161 [Gaeumannomyces tritici R3-111a-1]EJT76239.1 hypothetical protein GGTG_06161 [Gaeumannomyces tritici R3-111a-1]